MGPLCELRELLQEVIPMRRNATCLLLSALIPVVIVGCKAAGPGEAVADPSVAVSDPYTLPVETSIYEPEPYTTYGSPVTGEVAREPVAPAGAAPRYHTVAKSDTLYSLARQYYGDHHRWKEIYGANRSAISDPNMIRIGQRLVIP